VSHPPDGLIPELAEFMSVVVGPGGEFGHRQHVHLAFLAARRYGTAAAPDLLCGWIKQIAASHGAARKYHATMTIAWARLVAYHLAADPEIADFAMFASRYPALLDKDLLASHYTQAALASAQARTGWLAPDRANFPWLT